MVTRTGPNAAITVDPAALPALQGMQVSSKNSCANHQLTMTLGPPLLLQPRLVETFRTPPWPMLSLP